MEENVKQPSVRNLLRCAQQYWQQTRMSLSMLYPSVFADDTHNWPAIAGRWHGSCLLWQSMPVTVGSDELPYQTDACAQAGYTYGSGT